jgi:hypothetical protein
MTNCTALSNTGTSLLSPLTTSLENLPARLGKRLWVTPAEFLQTTCAMQVAHWAVNLFPPSLPDSHRRGRKRRYSDESILLVAYIQSAWQMSYEMVVDYFRNHPEAAKQAGFEDGQVISVGQYWERRRTLGIWVFWLFFVGMVWQLYRRKIIHGVDVVLIPQPYRPGIIATRMLDGVFLSDGKVQFGATKCIPCYVVGRNCRSCSW